MTSQVDFGDVQGIVRFGYSRMTEACYFLVRVREPSATRAWLSTAPVSSALKLDQPPKTALQVGLTSQGMESLGLPQSLIGGFSDEFIFGMSADENRSRRLGDIGANSPSNWSWGKPSSIPHVVMMLFAEPGLLESWKSSVKGPSWNAAFEEIACLPTSNMDGREPFGFVDGLSQPEIDWNQTRKVPINGNEHAYSNVVCLGEFLLGYRNEYGRYTDRPLLEPQGSAAAELPFAEDQPAKKDLGRNGTYVVMRQLAQNVRDFWQALDRATNSNADERWKLGSYMVGRRLADGAPLVPLSRHPIAGIDEAGDGLKKNLFTYDSDVDGTRCPFGAHIRRANPRNADIPGGSKGLISTVVRTLGFGKKNIRDDLIAPTRFHRLLRRGREYGPNLYPENALESAPPGDPERGLHFLAINANIQRQFEFVQSAWIMRTKFDGLTEESDPLLGNRLPVSGCPFTDTFSIPLSSGIRRRIMALPQFITVRGGGYFFLPSMSALRYLSRLGE